MIRCGLRIFPRGGLYQEISGRARDFFLPSPLSITFRGGVGQTIMELRGGGGGLKRVKKGLHNF